LPSDILESLHSQSCDAQRVVLQLQENLQLNQSSLDKPESRTRGWIRCLACEAKSSNKLDVVKHLREIVPAGTTGKCEKDVMTFTPCYRKYGQSEYRKSKLFYCYKCHCRVGLFPERTQDRWLTFRIFSTRLLQFDSLLKPVHMRELAPETRSRVSTPTSTREGQDEGAE